MTKDNRGFSLIEMVVVVAIIIVLSTAAALSMAAVSGKPAEQCAQSLKVEILSNRTVSLGKKDATLTISKQSDGIHVTEAYTLDSGSVTNDRVIAPNTVDISFSSDGSSYTAIDASGIVLEFDRSSGSLKNYSSNIFFKSTKAGKTYKVTVYQLTGKAIAEAE